jgi:hypothetical protein
MADLVAFNLHHFRHSPTIRSMQRRSFVISTLAAFFCALGVSLVTRVMPFWPSLLTAFSVAAYTGLYFLYYFKRGYIKRVSKMVRRMYSEDKNPGTLGEHTLEVDEEGFTDLTDYRHTRYAWGALVRIESEPGYTYLYTGSQSAFVIRHEAITSGDFKTVLEQMGRHYQPDKTLTAASIPQVVAR